MSTNSLNFDDSFFSAVESVNSSFDSCHSSLGVEQTLGESLHEKFQGFQANFNVCHINAQSIPFHYTEALEAFSSDYLSAILVSETLLKPSLPSSSYSLPGFVLIRNDRVNKGGGELLYIFEVASHLK